MSLIFYIYNRLKSHPIFRPLFYGFRSTQAYTQNGEVSNIMPKLWQLVNSSLLILLKI